LSNQQLLDAPLKKTDQRETEPVLTARELVIVQLIAEGSQQQED
jgi:DNA-binding NarL/FixJ family response regulator